LRVNLCVVGRLKGGPEKALFDDYLARFDKAGRGLGLGMGRVIEVEAKKGGMAAEADMLRKAIPGAFWVMDERGERLSSPDFAGALGRFRDAGRGDLSLVIGGADGLAPELRAEADAALSFGAMVWPHMLARVMLSEQLYRAASIPAGSPYHRA